MKDKQVLRVKFHVGVYVGPSVMTSVDMEKDQAKMEILPVGVLIKHKGAEVIVPFANIHQINVK